MHVSFNALLKFPDDGDDSMAYFSHVKPGGSLAGQYFLDLIIVLPLRRCWLPSHSPDYIFPEILCSNLGLQIQ